MKKNVLIPLSSASVAHPSPADVDVLLGNARLLQSAARHRGDLLRGKRLALLSDAEDGPDAALFRAAATALGADVSHIRPRLADLHRADELRDTARLLGRLYDGIECQGLAAALVEAVGREAGVPVYDGLASSRHPTACLVDSLDGDAAPARRRQLVLETVLLSTLA